MDHELFVYSHGVRNYANDIIHVGLGTAVCTCGAGMPYAEKADWLTIFH